MLKLALFIAFMLAATAHAADWAPCQDGAVVNDDTFLAKHDLAIRFEKPFALTPGSRLTSVDHMSGWKKYWGTASAIQFTHARDAGVIASGETIEIKEAMHVAGDMNSLLSSDLTILSVGSAKIDVIKLFVQPYSSMHVRKMNRILGATLMCRDR